MENPALIPVIVAVMGIAQLLFTFLTGRRNQQALATKNEASAVKEIAASYQLLVESLETRLGYLQESYHRLEKESLSQAKIIVFQQTQIRQLKQSEEHKS